MKKWLLLLLAATQTLRAQVPPEETLPLADPFIYWDGAHYYAYGTCSDDGIVVLVSDDLENWYWPLNRCGFLALNRSESYGDRWFWAPEVYRIGDLYYMYYSSDEHICLATATSPLGPFRQAERRPMRDEKGIDNTLFIDDDGTPYLFWVRFNEGNEIWSARLEADLQRFVPGSERFCIRTSQDWERISPAVNEGPFVVRHNGTYYLTYSGNNFWSPDYAIGCATAPTPEGPWTKDPANPLLCRPGELVGTGHHAFFTDRDGVQRIVFHAHYDATHLHPRSMHLTVPRFIPAGDGPDRMTIDPHYTTPRLVTDEAQVPQWVLELR